MKTPDKITQLISTYKAYGDIIGILHYAKKRGIKTNRVTLSHCLNGKSCNLKLIQLIADFYIEKSNKLKKYEQQLADNDTQPTGRVHEDETK